MTLFSTEGPRTHSYRPASLFTPLEPLAYPKASTIMTGRTTCTVSMKVSTYVVFVSAAIQSWSLFGQIPLVTL